MVINQRSLALQFRSSYYINEADSQARCDLHNIRNKPASKMKRSHILFCLDRLYSLQVYKRNKTLLRTLN